MNQEKINSEKWSDSAVNLVEAYRDLISIRVIGHVSNGVSISIVAILCLVFAVFVLLFTGFGSAWWLGEHLGNMKAGFFIMAGSYTLIFGILLATAQKVLIPWIRNIIIKKMYEDD